MAPTIFSSRDVPPFQPENDSDDDEIESNLISSRSNILQSRYSILQNVDFQTIQRIFLMPHNDTLVLIEKFNIPITPKKLSYLRSDMQLNDEVINFCQELYSERDALLCILNPIGRRKSHYFSSFFIEKLLGPHHLKYNYDGVARWSRKFDIFELEKIFFPINIEKKSELEIGHWTGVIIYVQRKWILFNDSCGGEGGKYKIAFFKWLEDEALHKKNETFNDEGWRFIPVKDFPRQGAGCDCGVFMTMAFNFHMDDLPITFTQSNMASLSQRNSPWKFKLLESLNIACMLHL